MLIWVIVFLAVALVAGVFGFTGIAAASAGIAQILCVIFLGLTLAALAAYQMNRRDDEEKADRDTNRPLRM